MFYTTVEDSSKIQPLVSVLFVGQSGHFSCDSNELTVWFFEKSKGLPRSPPISYDKMYSLINAQISEEGFYFCYGKYEGEPNYFIGKAKLYVQGAFVRGKIVYPCDG